MSKKLDLRQIKEDSQQAGESAMQPEVKTERYEITPREVSFTVAYDTPEGEHHEATLFSRVLDGDGRLQRTRVYNRLVQGIDIYAIPEAEQLRLDAISRILTQIENLPEWVIRWIGMDVDFLSRLNAVLVGHESRYFRGNAEKGEGGKVKTRVSITSPFDQDAETT